MRELKSFRWEFEVGWTRIFGSPAVELIVSEDKSRPWKTEVFHVFKLESGQYATVWESGYTTVWESGCSCYRSSDAVIDLLPSEKKAMEQFEKWKKEVDERRSFC